MGQSKINIILDLFVIYTKIICNLTAWKHHPEKISDLVITVVSNTSISASRTHLISDSTTSFFCKCNWKLCSRWNLLLRKNNLLVNRLIFSLNIFTSFSVWSFEKNLEFLSYLLMTFPLVWLFGATTPISDNAMANFQHMQ